MFGPNLALLGKKIDLPGVHLSGGLCGVRIDDGLQVLGQQVEPLLAEKGHRKDEGLVGLGNVFRGVPKCIVVSTVMAKMEPDLTP